MSADSVMPATGSQLEIRKRQGGGYCGEVTAVAMVGFARGQEPMQDCVVAVVDLGGGSRSSARLHQDEAGRWYALEQELMPCSRVQGPTEVASA